MPAKLLAALLNVTALPYVPAASPPLTTLPEGIEATYWSRSGRTFIFLLRDLEIEGGPQGGPIGLVRESLPLEVELAGDVRDAVDERTGARLPNGRRFRFTFDTAEAVLFSFAGPPPRPSPAAGSSRVSRESNTAAPAAPLANFLHGIAAVIEVCLGDHAQ